MAQNDDDMWNGRPAAARLAEDLAPPQPVRHHPLRVTTILLGVACAVFAPVLLETEEFLALVLAGAFVGGAQSALLWTATNRSHTVTLAVLARISGSAAAGSVIAVAFGCLNPSIGAPGAFLVLATVVSLPYLLRRLTARSGGFTTDPSAEARQAPTLLTPPLTGRSTAEILAAWTESDAVLRRTSSPHERARIAGLRQAYLDELERRDAEGVSRWLGSGRAHSSDPARFLDARDRDEPEPETP